MNCEENSDKRPEKRVFGRRLGRPLKTERAEVIDMLLARKFVSTSILHEDGKLDISELFEESRQTCML